MSTYFFSFFHIYLFCLLFITYWKKNSYNIKYTVDGVERESEFSFIFITNSNRVGGVNNIYDDVKLDDNKFEVLLCNIKNKKDILKAVYYLKRKDLLV